jgi:NAD(P)-dependent dehydrogenase (short-subunit alcohol dehydrogenase family)
MNDTPPAIALVTGASRGIGRATALALARAGTRVIVHYGRAAAEAAALVAEIRAAGGMADAVGADLAAADGPARLAAEVKAIAGDRLDVLVANAGIAGAATIAYQTIADFDAYFAVNVRAPYFLVQQLLPLLHAGASVILLSSVAAVSVVSDLSAYSATKGAIDTLVKHFAAALGGRGIRVNAVAPGVIDTDMSSFARTDQGRDFVLGMQALKRLGKPEDIADVVAFLASDAARWITGTTIRVDGGSKL